MNKGVSKGWTLITIGKSLKLRSGNFLSSANMHADGKYPVYGGNGINGYHSNYMFEERKIVLGRVGAYCGVVHHTLPNSWITDNALYIAEKDPRFLDEYLVLALRQANLNQYASQFGQPLISHSRLENVELLIPPLDEQKRIATILSKADRLRRLRRYACELSEGYLQSVFLEMFGDPMSNPRGWKIKTLSDLKTKFAYGTSEKCYSEPKGFPVLRIPNVLGQKIDLSDLKYAELPDKEVAKLLLAPGDLVFVRTNGNPDYVGRCAVFDLNSQYLYASYLIRARLELEKINPWFLETYLHTSSGRKAMSPYIRTTAGQSNIGMEGLGQIPVPLPPLSLQQKFAQIVQKTERLRAQQRESERQAEHLFQSLLHRAFRGELCSSSCE